MKRTDSEELVNGSALAPAGHLESLPARILPSAIDDALRELAPSGRRKDILALFDNRITWGTVKNWRKRRHPLPLWARDSLLAKLRPLIERAALLEDAIRREPASRGVGSAGAQTLMAWNARRAAAKEKAPQT